MTCGLEHWPFSSFSGDALQASVGITKKKTCVVDEALLLTKCVAVCNKRLIR